VGKNVYIPDSSLTLNGNLVFALHVNVGHGYTMKHLNKTEIMDLLEELGVETEPLENSRINAPKNIPNPYDKSMLEIIMERQDRFGERMDPNYRTIKEQEEEEEEE
jgi:NH3-dependent NAD+ synthetase